MSSVGEGVFWESIGRLLSRFYFVVDCWCRGFRVSRSLTGRRLGGEVGSGGFYFGLDFFGRFKVKGNWLDANTGLCNEGAWGW